MVTPTYSRTLAERSALGADDMGLTAKTAAPPAHSVDKVLQSMDVAVRSLKTMQHARQLLTGGFRPDLILTTVSFRDGNWCDLVALVVKSGLHCPVVLYYPAADEHLWFQAVWRGVFDVILSSYNAPEVERLVTRALSERPAGRSKPVVLILGESDWAIYGHDGRRTEIPAFAAV